MLAVCLVIWFASAAVVPAQDCICTISGDPHYYTYDGNAIHFQGLGRYLLTTNKLTNPKFKILGRNAHLYGYTHVSWTVGVDIRYNGYTIKMRSDGTLKVGVNGVVTNEFTPWSTPPNEPNSILVEMVGNSYFRVTTHFGLYLTFTYAGQYVYIKLPDFYRGDGKLSGICGSCNGNAEDDLNTRDGNPTTGSAQDRWNAVGNSYADGAVQNVALAPPPIPDEVNEPYYCGLLKDGEVPDNPLQSCLDFLGATAVNNHYVGCAMDVTTLIEDTPKEAHITACEAIDAVIEDCREEGVGVDLLWRDIAECPYTCDPPYVYTPDLPKCGLTCAQLYGAPCSGDESNLPEEGCICPEGERVSGNECVPEDECGCWIDGTYLKMGEKIRTLENCNEVCMCEGSNTVTYYDDPCLEGGCEVKDGQVQCINTYPCDCDDIYKKISNESGIYTIYLGPKKKPTEVYCVMDGNTDSGCAVIQRRFNGELNFDQNWQSYKDGFGDLEEEFWLGNEALRLLTNQKDYCLSIELDDGVHEGLMRYDTFSVDDNKYMLHIGGFHSSDIYHFGDSMTSADGQKFSTFNKDNDQEKKINCAATYHSGWWFTDCFVSNLNGLYPINPPLPFKQGVIWAAFFGYDQSMTYSNMMVCGTCPE